MTLLNVVEDLKQQTANKSFNVKAINIGMYGWKNISFSSFERLTLDALTVPMYDWLRKLTVEYVEWDYENSEININVTKGFFNRF